MKFQALYDAAKAKEGRALVVRIDDNVIPFDGWYVESGEVGTFYMEPIERFDAEVAAVVSLAVNAQYEHIAIKVTDTDVFTSYGHVFGHARKEYAMGYSHGAGLEGIYDVGTGKLIKRK